MIIRLILAIIIAVLIYKITNLSVSKRKISTFTINRIEKTLKSSKVNHFSYEEIEKYLRKNGVENIFENKKITPQMFILVRIFMGILFMMVGIKEELWIAAVLLGIVGFYSPNMMIKISNDSDNDKILVDLKNIYDTLRIQTKAGVYLTYALAECYLVARNSRLKKALLELNDQIIGRNDIENALDEFNEKFNSHYIDTFCIVLKQSLESGKSVQILDDLSAQISDIQQTISLKEEESMKFKIEIIQLFIFVGVLAIVLYGISIELVTSLMNF